MSTLGRERINDFMCKADIRERLIITPLLDKSQIGQASVDLRLGHEFTVTRRGNLGSINPAQRSFDENRYQSRHHVNQKEEFFLHPNELVLAGTLEYIRLPSTLAATVTSRSSWGRAGLVIATATAVHPGFTGVITLELINHGEVPLVLYPGLRVAQLVLSYADGATQYEGKFSYRTAAWHPNIARDQDPDMEFWVPSVDQTK